MQWCEYVCNINSFIVKISLNTLKIALCIMDISNILNAEHFHEIILFIL